MSRIIDCYTSYKARLGEGVFWHPLYQKLYWIDIENKKILILDPKTNQLDQHLLPKKIGTIVPEKQGSLLVALEDGVARYHTSTQELDYVCKLEQDKPDNRFNDGKCDPQGRFWLGSMHRDAQRPTGSLYRIDNDMTISTIEENVRVSNGLTWSLDYRKMYYIDSPTHKVVEYDYNKETGHVSNKKVCIEIPSDKGSPDGMTIDQNGNLWIALWDGYAVGCYDPNTGQQIDKIEVPCPRPTCCAFGGASQDLLYITSAYHELSEETLNKYPDSGCVFVAEMNSPGPEVFFFG